MSHPEFTANLVRVILSACRAVAQRRRKVACHAVGLPKAGRRISASRFQRRGGPFTAILPQQDRSGNIHATGKSPAAQHGVASLSLPDSLASTDGGDGPLQIPPLQQAAPRSQYCRSGEEFGWHCLVPALKKETLGLALRWKQHFAPSTHST